MVLSVRTRRSPRDEGGLIIEERLRQIGLLSDHEISGTESTAGALALPQPRRRRRAVAGRSRDSGAE